jgi:hypothetical protein
MTELELIKQHRLSRQRNKYLLLKNVLYLFLLVNPSFSLKAVFINWDRAPSLKAYKRPDFDLLEQIYKEVAKELKR